MADAPALGAGGLTPVEVQVLSLAANERSEICAGDATVQEDCCIKDLKRLADIFGAK